MPVATGAGAPAGVAGRWRPDDGGWRRPLAALHGGQRSIVVTARAALWDHASADFHWRHGQWRRRVPPAGPEPCWRQQAAVGPEWRLRRRRRRHRGAWGVTAGAEPSGGVSRSTWPSRRLPPGGKLSMSRAYWDRDYWRGRRQRVPFLHHIELATRRSRPVAPGRGRPRPAAAVLAHWRPDAPCGQPPAPVCWWYSRKQHGDCALASSVRGGSTLHHDPVYSCPDLSGTNTITSSKACC